ncbi:Suppressor of G2 allele of SKP1, putative [Trypanosoma equiperdum]|uniref:Phosphatase-like protein, putative n=4 Tax=Trypanozoon TaxID=39700 RepID=Q4GYQ3_TRYB2|nr:phosphatase-like protein, putative [Trypanosoma brucei brucei TREU927]XP_011771471.1 phosphatase-like protein, putative [Trypanosoma brucei gambiense DAL972]RHW74174.1 Suppressor of G2 allele of SKP1 [Trypanosoma brucei equiperdum]SCU67477.1 Suppressor of G2 allele of SKP1, putative [Trypanosoma equiperdum]CAJ16531.1 phosphatase-like protein, putative [Trypanosoma brucei brucei TREU927]CBH09030.1 phosphatase-like protein, putative [Trypanosoma brucei gambiense DAL972]|eukprot:XP_011771471.1 phosphatase-like protein, putative [Trypanosoma brucei gambiense DAL972]
MDASSAATTKPFQGNVRCEWFQTPSQVTFTFYVKERQRGDVRADVTEQSLTVSIRLDPSGREYQYNVERFYAPLAEASATINISGMKVEVQVRKAVEQQWPTLEAPEDDVVLPSTSGGTPTTSTIAGLPATAKDLPYPNSRGRDWSAVKLDDDDEKPEGDQALNALFQKIYGNGTDEQRRAMMKSFVESNGTVLSTNWADVGNRHVTTEPPTGMEEKKYEG